MTCPSQGAVNSRDAVSMLLITDGQGVNTQGVAEQSAILGHPFRLVADMETEIQLPIRAGTHSAVPVGHGGEDVIPVECEMPGGKSVPMARPTA